MLEAHLVKEPNLAAHPLKFGKKGETSLELRYMLEDLFRFIINLET